MFIGIDAGGTNTDGVLLSKRGVEGVSKVPSTPNDVNGIKKVLKSLKNASSFELSDVDRVVIGTTLILNSIIEGETEDCGCVLIPGPGLDPNLASFGEYNKCIDGYVDHRGRVVENVDKNAVKNFKISHEDDVGVYAIISKFSNRNSSLEDKVKHLLDGKPVSMGNEISGDLSFPLRSSSTVLNAKSKPVFKGFTENIRDILDDLNINANIYFIKSDGAMVNREVASRVPSMTIKSGPAVSTLGLYALSGVNNALNIDIGGTTTDLGIISDGNPQIEDKLEILGYKTFYSSIESVDIPLGGDSLVEVESDEIKIRKKREGQAAAFGGDYPTLTDALHVLGEFTNGNVDLAQKAIENLSKNVDDSTDELAKKIVLKFSREISKKSKKFIQKHKELQQNKGIKILGGGVLSKYIVPRISEELDIDYLIPNYADVAGAIGAGISKVSIKTGIHIDTAKGDMTVNGRREDVKKGKKFSKNELKEIANQKTLEAANKAGLKSKNNNIEINYLRSFNVVENHRVKGQISDIEAQIEPGVTQEINLNQLKHNNESVKDKKPLKKER